MLIEIRRYSIVPGRRDEFVQWFEEEVRPAMTAAGIRILGSFVSQDDPDVFVYLRGFADEEERERLTSSFHGSEAWTGGLRARALEMETGYEVEVVRSTGGSEL
jgi:heme-degrading monooxygenase HmoA